MSSKTIYMVYRHTSPSGKSYIGQTYDYEDRCYRHQLKSSGCRAFYLAIQKYGWDNFTHEILYDNLTQDQANYREQQAINEYGSMVPYGYNLLAGGNSHSPSIETRQRISATTTGRKRGPDTPEMIAAKSARMIGRKPSAETRAKMSATRSGRAAPESQKLKVSKRYVVTPPGGEPYEIINLNQFCKDQNLDGSAMNLCARGRRGHHKGWMCRYAD